MEVKELGVCSVVFNKLGTPFDNYHNVVPCLSWFFRKGARCILCNKWWSLNRLNKIQKGAE